MTLDERLTHITEAKKKLGTTMPWLADSITNDLKHAFGDKNNSEFVISPEGKVLIARSWSKPEQLREDLAKLVGESETATTIADLNLKREPRPQPTKTTSGVVPRVSRPSGAVALVAKSTPSSAENGDSQPLYVKLRAEAPQSLLRSGGKGKLYLGFHLDPIHHVHWNNLAAPLKFKIKTPAGVTLSETKGTAAKPEKAEADLDPREFLLDVDLSDSTPSEPLLLEVTYFACDNDNQWCKVVTQNYAIEFRADRDAGRVTNRGASGGKGMPSPEKMMSRLDNDGDGKISKDEAGGPIERRFDQIDTNEDGFVDAEELKKMMDQMKKRQR